MMMMMMMMMMTQWVTVQYGGSAQKIRYDGRHRRRNMTYSSRATFVCLRGELWRKRAVHSLHGRAAAAAAAAGEAPQLPAACDARSLARLVYFKLVLVSVLIASVAYRLLPRLANLYPMTRLNNVAASQSAADCATFAG